MKSAMVASTATFEEINLIRVPSGGKSTHDAILARPPGPYTVMRTVGGIERIFRLGDHIHRLTNAMNSYIDALPNETTEKKEMLKRVYADCGVMRKLVCECTYSAVQGFVHSATGKATLEEGNSERRKLSEYDFTKELRILVHIAQKPASSQGSGEIKLLRDGLPRELALFFHHFEVYVHVSLLPPLPKPPVNAVVDVFARANATVKSSSWVKHSEARFQELIRKEENENEIVMIDEDGNFYEGFSSNFFAVVRSSSSDGKTQGALEIQTAGDDRVLKGTMRPLVLAASRTLNLSVKESSPHVTKVHDWAGCGISSTSRLFLPIHRLRFTNAARDVLLKSDAAAAQRLVTLEDGSSAIFFETSPNSITMRIADAVYNHFTEESESYFSE